MSDFLDPVLLLYPKRVSEVRARALRDPLFRSACQDYCDANEALKKWRASGSPHAAERIAEFARIVKEIGAEIDELLELDNF